MFAGMQRFGWMLAFCGLVGFVGFCEANDTLPQPDPYAAPANATEEQLAEQFERLLNTPPPVQTPDGIREHLRGIRRFTMALSAPERTVSDDLLEGALQIEYQILTVLERQFLDPNAAQERAAFLTRLGEDERPIAKNILQIINISEKISQLAQMADNDRSIFIEEIAVALQGPFDQNAAQFAMMVGEQMEDVAPEQAAGVYELFVKYLRASGDPTNAIIAEQFQGKANYLGLLGNVMEFTSTTVAGEAFDIAAYRRAGKVVLVDFWATWCGPCRAELPNLKAHYEAYRGQGFEVVGISLDDDMASLQQFLAAERIPWVTLVDAKPENQGWDNPLARQFGISAIPACILLDQEGKVVSLNARGPELGRLLMELLGPPAAPAGQ